MNLETAGGGFDQWLAAIDIVEALNRAQSGTAVSGCFGGPNINTLCVLRV